MQATASATVAQNAGRVLKPAAILGRFRPVRLAVLGNELEEARRTARAVALIARFFPYEMRRVNRMAHWIDLLRQFLGLVQDAGWFEISWLTLDYLWEWAMDDSPEDDEEPSGLYYLAQYLWGVPVRLYGYGGDMWDETTFDQYPPMGVLARLLGHQNLGTDFLIEFDIWDNLADIKREKIEANLERAASTRPEPLCWLPEMARVATGHTGLALVDESPDDLHDLWPERWRWDDADDLRFLRTEYQRARPVLARVKKFLEWAEGEDQIRQIVEIALGGQYEPEW